MGRNSQPVAQPQRRFFSPLPASGPKRAQVPLGCRVDIAFAISRLPIAPLSAPCRPRRRRIRPRC